jgi:DNA primase
MAEPAMEGDAFAAANAAATPDADATPMPEAPKDIEAEYSEDDRDEVVLNIGHRRYRVRGLSKNLSYDLMRVNVLASTERGLFVDTFDLYSARHRRQFIVQAAIELGVEEKTVKKDLGRVLMKLEDLQEKQIEAAMEPRNVLPTMTPQEKEDALRLLRDPKLLERIVEDVPLVGEATNKLVGYLSAVSRKLDQPLAVIIQSSSAAGKTTLMEAVLSFVPSEDQVKFSAMTGQSLFYMDETGLKHKILAIVEEEGAERASYALKLLQSEGELMIASTGKDVSSGRLVTQTYRVEGPVMIFLTTTAIKIDEELLNRCIVLTVDEDREQTRAIHRQQRQRQTLQGLLSSQDHQRTLTIHRNAQRLLRPLLVANPYAEELTFLDNKTRTRRDHLKYLTLIRAVALLHQYQRPVRTVVHNGEEVQYIEATVEDIEIANRLASEVLGRSVDDLPPQTQRLLRLIEQMVDDACERQGIDRTDFRFTRRDVRDATGWGNTQLKVHLKRLEELEYLLVHRGGRGQSFVYELLHGLPSVSDSRFLAGLIDVDRLRQKLSRANGKKSGHGRPQVGIKSGAGRPGEIDASPDDTTGMPTATTEPDRTALQGSKSTATS